MSEIDAGLLLLLIVGTLTLSAVLAGLLMRFGPLDIPNERSSHESPTPRGGGIAIVFSVTLCCFLLWWWGLLQSNLMLAMTVSGLAVAFVGYLDDLSGLSAWGRLIVHFVAALIALSILDDGIRFQIGSFSLEFSGLLLIVPALGVVWFINLFNFMDGIDGLASSEAIFVMAVGSVLLGFAGGSSGLDLAAIVVASACLGFLVWNLPPARIFLGDAGSGYLGFIISLFGVEAATENGAAMVIWLMLVSVFVVDASTTLVRRAFRGESIHQAHRSHAYQVLSRRWSSHGKVTGLAVLINVCAILPATIWYLRTGSQWIPVSVLGVLIIAAWSVGAGHTEQHEKQS